MTLFYAYISVMFVITVLTLFVAFLADDMAADKLAKPSARDQITKRKDIEVKYDQVDLVVHDYYNHRIAGRDIEAEKLVHDYLNGQPQDMAAYIWYSTMDYFKLRVKVVDTMVARYRYTVSEIDYVATKFVEELREM